MREFKSRSIREYISMELNFGQFIDQNFDSTSTDIIYVLFTVYFINC